MEKLYELLEWVAEEHKKECTDESLHTVRQQLQTYINDLIQHDFAKLIELLYRVDINEKKLKELLAANQGINSAVLISDLLIERQLQKRAWRQTHKPDADIPDEERW